MRELSLFSGVGGGLLGTKTLGFKAIGYVEFNKYCQQVLQARIHDKTFDEAPIFTDVREFILTGAVDQYRGFTDLVTAGFPCQPFSVAGKRKASDDERNMWPATMGVIKAVQPKFCFLENVPGLLSATVDDSTGRPVHYFGTILRDLAKGGYDARWCLLGASDVGAPHKRKRLWIFAYAKSLRRGGRQSKKRTNEKINVANSNKRHRNSQKPNKRGERKSGTSTNNNLSRLNTANPNNKREKGIGTQAIQREQRLPWDEDLRSLEDLQNRPDIPEPLIRGMDDGMANRTHRLAAIGNGQVPQTVVAAWNLLTKGII